MTVPRFVCHWLCQCGTTGKMPVPRSRHSENRNLCSQKNAPVETLPIVAHVTRRVNEEFSVFSVQISVFSVQCSVGQWLV
jgi:hypothetical protein